MLGIIIFTAYEIISPSFFFHRFTFYNYVYDINLCNSVLNIYE